VNEIPQFETRCTYRSEKMYCWRGNLYVARADDDEAADRADPATVEGVPVKCPACKGKDYILTPAGKELVEMLWRHLEPRIVELIDEFRKE